LALVAGVWLGNDDGSPTHKMTGGGLPVEIWSRFMKAALRGIPVAGLPGLPGGAPILAAPMPANAPSPPVAVASNRTTSPGGGMDNWLLEKLFGRR
jgi:penicillin-binding protein 1A